MLRQATALGDKDFVSLVEFNGNFVEGRHVRGAGVGEHVDGRGIAFALLEGQARTVLV